MSTGSPPDVGGHDAYGYFLTTDIPEEVGMLVAIQKLALTNGWRNVLEEATKITTGLLEDVNQIARLAAKLADAAIIRVLIETRASNRPFRGLLESHIRSEPFPLGGVKVALIEELDKAINPDTGDYGPFWRAQEYGTGSNEVPSQEGRVFHGVFNPSGNNPDAAQRGLRRGSDLVFQSGAGGFGTISVELPGRHFLRDGTAEAAKIYMDSMERIAQKWGARIRELAVLARQEHTRVIRFELDA